MVQREEEEKKKKKKKKEQKNKKTCCCSHIIFTKIHHFIFSSLFFSHVSYTFICLVSTIDVIVILVAEWSAH